MADKDYIERSKAMEHRVITDIGIWSGFVVPVKAIENIPAADVKPVVHGHWIWKHRHRGGFKKVSGVDVYGNEHTIIIDDRYEIDDPYCSECGLLNDSSSLKFCPNCGADMRDDETAIS